MMRYSAQVHVTLKPTVNDPQGLTILASLRDLSFDTAQSVRVGKYLEVPAHKLMGQKVRDHVPVAAWTRPASPQDFQKEIVRAMDHGYTIFKMHTCTYHDVIEQTLLAEKVAPEGFQIHYDLNGNRTLASALPLIKRLERDHPIVVPIRCFCRTSPQNQIKW